jgi:hypothetical protein
MKTSKLVRFGALMAVPLVLVGCRAGYDVDVRNLTDQPITAKLTAGHTDGAPLVLREKYIGIGDRTSLFVQRDANVPVALVVDFQGNIGHPATVDLSKGSTVVNVRRADEGSRGRLQLEVIPRP